MVLLLKTVSVVALPAYRRQFSLLILRACELDRKLCDVPVPRNEALHTLGFGFVAVVEEQLLEQVKPRVGVMPEFVELMPSE